MTQLLEHIIAFSFPACIVLLIFYLKTKQQYQVALRVVARQHAELQLYRLILSGGKPPPTTVVHGEEVQ